MTTRGGAARLSTLPQCLAVVVGFFVSTLSAQIVEISDPELQKVVRTALNKPAGEIMLTDMESLTELDASLRGRGYMFGDPVPPGVGQNPITALAVPVWTDMDLLSIDGFPKTQVTFHAGTIKIQNGELHWREGILEYKAHLSDPWMPLPASSPLPLWPIGEKGFFRVKVEP